MIEEGYLEELLAAGLSEILAEIYGAPGLLIHGNYESEHIRKMTVVILMLARSIYSEPYSNRRLRLAALVIHDIADDIAAGEEPEEDPAVRDLGVRLTRLLWKLTEKTLSSQD